MTDEKLAPQYHITVPDELRTSETLPWVPHTKFAGVYLKHLITGADTDGLFSIHLVYVEKGCEIGTHTHNPQWEVHNVVQGSARAWLGDEELHYTKGTLVAVPKGIPHRVLAEDEAVVIMAKFVPPLL